MQPGAKRLYKALRAGDRSFSVYLEYDKPFDETYPAYPDFAKEPEYSDDGHPFATAVQESCSHAQPNASGEEPPGDCGGCSCFYREQTPYDLIGVCRCEARRIKSNQTGRK